MERSLLLNVQERSMWQWRRKERRFLGSARRGIPTRYPTTLIDLYRTEPMHRFTRKGWKVSSGLFFSCVPMQPSELYAVGVGVHHAGLSTEDRRIVEQHFSQKRIQVLFATSVSQISPFQSVADTKYIDAGCRSQSS